MKRNTKILQYKYIFIHMIKISLKLKRFLKISKIVYITVHKAYLIPYTMYIIISIYTKHKKN